MDLIHVAGIPVMILGTTRIIQRCAICGLKLIDSTGEDAVLVGSGAVMERAKLAGCWQPGALVEYDEAKDRQVAVQSEYFEKHLEASCVSLVE